MGQENIGPFVLASVVSYYPDENFSASLDAFLSDETIQLPENLRELFLELTKSDAAINDLRSEYIALFDQSKSLNPLYETEYGRERAMFKANELADIAGFYHAFGFEYDGAIREMVDHISVELEFYSLLLMKHNHLAEIMDLPGAEIVFDGLKKFLGDHLGRFPQAILARPGVQGSPFYSVLFAWIDSLVKKQCESLNVTPVPITWMASQLEDEAISCGGSVCGK